MSAVVDSTDSLIRRPGRADARRNFDALLTSARATFTEQGTSAALEEIARRAGVGIGTLYRNFPTREALIEAVYLDGIDELVRAADAVAGLPPWEAFESWLWRYIDYAATKSVLISAINNESPALQSCRRAFYDAAQPLFDRAIAAGQLRADASCQDIMRLISGVAGVTFSDADQRLRVLAMAIDGLRTRN
ncbi:TetR/AcrR family transcriptional regulator [Devosia beringensis]|uniref:TetR/AcrR family transcriptional regulator n=1 Tax=Devosia beringensis TaxID=2657486 RepID=UPI00186B669E|nr:TetR/AcrR family transcriptional regulator [Devosia beringensis]